MPYLVAYQLVSRTNLSALALKRYCAANVCGYDSERIYRAGSLTTDSVHYYAVGT